MVSLPPITLQEGSRGFSNQSQMSSHPNKRTTFSGECNQDLILPISTINPQIVQRYKERYSQLQSIAKLFFKEQTNDIEEKISLEEQNSKFQIDDVSEESLEINVPDDFPLVDQSKLIPPKKLLDWKTITEETRKNPRRCNIIRVKPQQRQHPQKRRIRDLPALISSGNLTKLPSVCPDNQQTQKLLHADPTIVVFDDFEVGVLYKKNCKITNVSPGKCAFTLDSLKANSQFQVEWDRKGALAAGMSTQLTVLFQHCFPVDVEEKLVLLVQNRPELTIHLVALSYPPPHLIEIISIACNITSKHGGKIDSLIDCGSHFVGEQVKKTVNLKNIGPKARFCFVKEIDWYNMELVIDSSNSLVFGSFTVEPMLFTLNKGQTIEICFSFNAPSPGFHTDQVFVLCDNCSVICVDLESDGYWFDPLWIEFPGLSKLFDVDIEDDQTVDFYLDFGSALRFFNLSLSFLLFHNGYVNMSYHWEIRTTEIQGAQPLPEGSLIISPASGRLYADTVKSFCLECDTSFLQAGRYRMLLVLIVDDLPKKCVPLHLHGRLRPLNENDDDSELHSIEVTSIEVWVECVKPNVTLFPYVVEFSESPLFCGNPKETREITVRNNSPNSVWLSWHCESDSPLVRLYIEPEQLTCQAFSSTTCTVSVEALHEGPFTAVFKCISDNEDFGLELQINGNCCKKQLRMITDFVDLGAVKKGSQQTAQIIAESCSAEKTLWALNELIFNPCDNGYLESSETLESLSAHEGEFCHKESQVFIKYQLDTQRDQLWCSVLDWGGQYVPVMADVQKADVSLSTHLLLADQLYLGVQYHCCVTVRNHTISSTPVFWGNPTVEPQGSVTLDVTPRFIVLEPCQEILTDIYFTPHAEGPLKGFYVPCFVEGLRQPLLLKLEGVVEGLKVRVEWESETQHCCVVWPPDEHSESKKNMRHSMSLGSLICSCPPNSSGPESLVSECEESPELSRTLINPETSDDEKICSEEGEEENENISQISSIPYLNWPIIGGRYTRDPMCESLERHFRDLFILEELSEDENSNVYPEDHNVLSFHDIPVREAVTQVVYIRNDTMIATCFEACVVNNFERSQQPETTSVLERMERRVKSKINEDEWFGRVSKDRGLTVFVEPSRGELPAQDYVSLSVTVYALSWGCYSDALLLQLGDLDQLCLRLSVTVSQHPVSVQQLIRFGAVSFKSSRQCRHLKVENTSTVPVRICWQMFSQTADSSPFNLMLFDASPFDLHFTNFYGSFASPLFQVNEKYTVLGPCSSTNVKVNFYPKNTVIKLTDEKILETPKAILVGHVYLTDEARYITNTESCVRVDGWKLQPLKVDLEAHLELPTLSLLNVFNYQLVFKCTSYDVMSTQQKVWRQEKVITVQNKCYTDLTAMVSISGYFYVSKITYPCDPENKYSSKDEIFLRPGETCEVTIGCKVTQETLYDCFEDEPVTSSLPDTETGDVEYGYLWFVQKDLEQEVKLKLYIYQPVLRLSVTTLDFDMVYIGDTKGLVVIITAPIGKEYFEASIKSGSGGVFSIHDESGTLEPNIGFPLEISFSPQECVTYTDALVIRTCLDKIFWETPLIGSGTFDYKSHLY